MTSTFHLIDDLDHGVFKVGFRNNCISGIVGLIDVNETNDRMKFVYVILFHSFPQDVINSSTCWYLRWLKLVAERFGLLYGQIYTISITQRAVFHVRSTSPVTDGQTVWYWDWNIPGEQRLYIGHQQPWHWFCRINRRLYSMRQDFNSLHHLSVFKQ